MDIHPLAIATVGKPFCRGGPSSVALVRLGKVMRTFMAAASNLGDPAAQPAVSNSERQRAVHYPMLVEVVEVASPPELIARLLVPKSVKA